MPLSGDNREKAVRMIIRAALWIPAMSKILAKLNIITFRTLHELFS